MRIGFDADGTIIKDFGRDYEKDFGNLPLMILVQELSKTHELWLITGRVESDIPPRIRKYFSRIIARDFPVEYGYYAKYFMWKVESVINNKIELWFDDDMQICRYLNAHEIPAVWTPAGAFNGIQP